MHMICASEHSAHWSVLKELGLPILVVWAIGAFFLLILRSYGRSRIGRYPVARPAWHRTDPRL